MVFPIVGGDGKPTGYDIENSLRLNNGDSPKFEHTFSAGNRRKFTFSTWLKRSELGDKNIISADDAGGSGGNNNFTAVYFASNDRLYIYDYTGSENIALFTTQVFQDTSAWYHLVLAFDTEQGTAANRIKVYVNGAQVTEFAGSTYPSQNYDTNFNHNGQVLTMFKYPDQNNLYYDGYIAETYFVDGQQYDPTYFGKFDDNNEWIPVQPGTGAGGSITYGTNGFLLEYKQTGTSANSSGIGADTSGQDNHFTPTNLAAVDINTDTPTNNFATMSNLYSDAQQGGAATFAEGNLQITTTYNSTAGLRYPQVYSTFAAQTGKYYYEMKITTSDTDSFIGIFSPEQLGYIVSNNPYGGVASTGIIYTSRGELRLNDGSTSGHGTFSQNDILGCALDIDNNKVYFHKNGTYIQSGDPAGNSGGQAIPAGFFYGFSVGNETASDSGTMQVNTGNPLFTISSGNADANGFGNFEYAVPSGFFAMCTKNIGEL